MTDERQSAGEAAHIIDASDMFSGWRTKLLKGRDKQPKPCITNVLTALRHAPEWKGVLRYDEFSYRSMISAAPPWVGDRAKWRARPWSDNDDCLTAEWLQRQGIMAKLSEIGPAVMTVAREHGYHPVRRYLDGLRWDQTERIDIEVPRLFGVPPAAYASAVFRCTMIAAVARIYQPGCKVDTVLMVEGDQGKRKSSAIERLFGKEWFTDDLAELGTKDAAMQMVGVWCIEIAELASMKRADVDRVKAFITRKVDRFRPPYGKNMIEAPRSSIMVATTNRDDWGQDETGGRRFWPVRCEGDIDLDGIGDLRDQLWAEAVERYHSGEPWWLTDGAVIETSRDEVDARAAGDPWDEPVQQALRLRLSVTVAEILDEVLKIERGRQDRSHQMRLAAVLKRLGWRKARGERLGKRANIYKPPEVPDG